MYLNQFAVESIETWCTNSS